MRKPIVGELVSCAKFRKGFCTIFSTPNLEENGAKFQFLIDFISLSLPPSNTFL